MTFGRPNGTVSAKPAWIREEKQDDIIRLVVGGDWTITHSPKLNDCLRALRFDGLSDIEIDASELSNLDTVGAWLLLRTNEKAAQGHRLRGFNVPPEFRSLIDTISEDGERLQDAPSRRPASHGLADLVADIGSGAIWMIRQAYALIDYLGLVSIESSGTVAHPRRLRLAALFNQIQQSGLNAMPIVGLLSFSIGVVFAYQGAEQLKKFDAELLTINLLGIGTIRELGGLMTAIMLAGRSGSAFTAQIGTMKLNQEIDAIETFGLDTIELLVLPRLLGLLIALPLLTLYADLMALFGGAVMCYFYLHITPAGFLHQLHGAVSLQTLWVGLAKTPVFAFIIAFIGCFEGMQVEYNAESVGRQTTRSVVESIFLIIMIDGGFSVLYSILGI